MLLAEDGKLNAQGLSSLMFETRAVAYSNAALLQSVGLAHAQPAHKLVLLQGFEP